MSAFSLLVISAFLHALWNALIKSSAKTHDSSETVFGVLFFATSLATLIFVLEPSQTGSLGILLSSESNLFFTITAGVCEGFYVIYLAKAMREADYSVAYTIMRGFAMVLVWGVSVSFLGEVFQARTGIGVFAVLLGLVMVSGGWREIFNRKSVFLSSYICAFFISGYHLCYERALKGGMNEFLLFPCALWVAVLLMAAHRPALIPKTVEDFFRLSKRIPSLIFIGSLCAISFIVFLLGLKVSAAGYAFTIRNSSILFAQILGVSFLKERHGLWGWLGAILVFVGAFLLPES